MQRRTRLTCWRKNSRRRSRKPKKLRTSPESATLTSTNRILLLGHRGARRYAPENTLTAFDLALEHGADGFEFDVRCTRNSHAIICHNARLNRLSVRRHTFKQLQASFTHADHSPPCLEDVLERFARTAFLNIEIKVRGMEKAVVRAVK